MRNLAAKLGRKAGVIAVICSAVFPAWPSNAIAAGRATTTITIDGSRPGPAFDGIGAISGGDSRLLIDYPPQQRAQILNYLFGPAGGRRCPPAAWALPASDDLAGRGRGRAAPGVPSRDQRARGARHLRHPDPGLPL